MTDESIITRNIRRFMEERNLTQGQVSDRSGIPLGTIMKYCDGQRTPRASKLVMLARAFGREPADFWQENPPPASTAPLPPALKVIGDLTPDGVKQVREFEQTLRKDEASRAHALKKKQRKTDR